MEVKVNPDKDLETQKPIFFQIGLVITLSIVLYAFEKKTYDKVEESIFTQQQIVNIEEEIEITRQEKPETPPPPQTPEIKIVEDDVEVEDDIFVDVEADQNTQVQEYYAPQKIETVEEEVVEQEIFTIVEEQPSFPGGEAELMKYLQTNIKYPQIAKESGIQGTVYVTFVVEPDGSVSNVKILRGIGGGCDEEAIRVVKSMPRWSPGKQRGKPVRVQFNLPIRFILQG